MPTLKELGYGIVAISPYGLAGPAGMPPTSCACCTTHSRRRCSSRRTLPSWPRYDQELAYLGPEEYGRAMRAAFAAEKRNVERLGLGKGS